MTVKAFLESHNRLFSIVGAGIVLLTFVIKEGLRDRVKDLADSINAAETLFLIRGDNTITSAQLSLLLQDVMHTERILEHKPIHDPAFENHFDNMNLTAKRSLVGQSNIIETSLDNISRLMETLPRDSAGTERLESLRAELWRNRLDPFWTFLFSYKLEELAGIPMTDEVYKSTSSKLSQLDQKMFNLADKTDAMAQQVLKGAEEARKRTEHAYSVFTWASYALFALGWSLGLLGSLFDVKGLDGAVGP